MDDAATNAVAAAIIGVGAGLGSADGSAVGVGSADGSAVGVGSADGSAAGVGSADGSADGVAATTVTGSVTPSAAATEGNPPRMSAIRIAEAASAPMRRAGRDKRFNRGSIGHIAVHLCARCAGDNRETVEPTEPIRQQARCEIEETVRV